MKDKFILSIDCGTQSVRALLFNKEGKMVAKEKKSFEPYFSSAPGYAEQNPEIYWESACYCCMKLKEEYLEYWECIQGITITTLRDTGICIDNDGNVLRPAILWLDQRMAECKNKLSLRNRLLFKAIGMSRAADISRKKSKVYWIREKEEEIWNKTYKYILLSCYFNYKLTGNIVDSIGSQIGHIPFDYKKRAWPQSEKSYRWELFGIDKNKLPELKEVGSILGYVTKKASKESGIKEGMPLIASGSDKGCETLGVGCLDLSCASLSFGTTATVQSMSDHYFEPIRFMPSYPASIPNHFNPEVEIFRGYWMISWFKKEFASREMGEAEELGISLEKLLNKKLCEVPPASLGLILQPYWGPGLKMPVAKGAIIGFGDVHTKVHFYRAIIEGINYGLLEGLEKIEKKSGVKAERIMVSGGGAQSDVICQITSDMFNRKVYKGETYEASGLGAAINGFTALGIHNSYEDAVKNMVHYSKSFTPTPKNAEIYNELFNYGYKKIYPSLKKIYSDIQRITGYPEI